MQPGTFGQERRWTSHGTGECWLASNYRTSHDLTPKSRRKNGNPLVPGKSRLVKNNCHHEWGELNPIHLAVPKISLFFRICFHLTSPSKKILFKAFQLSSCWCFFDSQAQGDRVRAESAAVEAQETTLGFCPPWWFGFRRGRNRRIW